MCFFRSNSALATSLFFFILVFTTYAQPTPYNPLQEKNWYYTYLISASKNGEWVHYLNNYLDGTKTTAVKNIRTGKTFEFPDGSWGKFSSNSKWFKIRTEGNRLMVVDFTKMRIDTISKVKYSYFDGTGGNYLITQSPQDSIRFTALDTKKGHSIGKSKNTAINPSKNVVAMALTSNKEETLQIFDLQTSRGLKIMSGKNMSFQRLTWNATGEKLAFLYSHNNGETYNVGMFDLKSHAVKSLNAGKYLKKKVSIANVKLSISDSGNKVFFSVKPKKNDLKDNSDPEIWDTFDTVLHTRKKFISSGKQGPWLHVWLPMENKVIPLGNKERPHVLFNPNSDYALNFDAYAREPQFHLNTFVDIYAQNVTNGKKELVVPNQFTAINFVHFSPKGNYVAYFKDHHWWIYDLQKRKHYNITINLPHSVFNKKSPSLDTPTPYGLAGWTKNGKELFLYDEFDVWKISNNGKKKEKLTSGRASKTTFRLVYGKGDKRTKYGALGFNTYSIDNEDGILLAAKNRQNLQKSYYQLKDNELRQIAQRDKRLSGLIQLNKDNFLFMQQSFAEPISIECVNLKTRSEKTIYKSNPEWNRFKWPKRELVEYDTEIADSLKGILIYPLNYDATKKYPMVVHIYAEQSFLYHEFTPPSPYNEVGFNFMNYALDGYFVFLPDIQYKINAPGISAAICIEKAIDVALRTAAIDEKRMGLIGHSHGGYDTAFIITQTDRFAAAVMGSGIFNLESFYFDIYKMAGVSEITRVEESHFSMNSSFYENPEAYRVNSPLHQAANINTPLLIWSGKEDANVNPNQSLQGYLALRRLRKPAKLIYYAGEGHILNNSENQKDLTVRLKKWFNSYLK